MLRAAAIILSALILQQELTEKERREFVDKNVDKAIEKGLKALRMMQRPSGRFEWFTSAPHGSTALALYTLLASGGTLEDTAAAKALDWILNNPFPWGRRGDYDTYEISLIAVALSYSIPHMAAGGAKDRAVAMLQRAADWLVAAQAKGGGWSYNQKNESHDHSNSQFGVLGLRAAANAGAKIKKEVWDKEVSHYKTSQLKDGGWGYHACYKDQTGTGRSTSTMTAAGVMGLAMALASASATDKTPESLASDAGIKKGLVALKDHWDKGVARFGIPNYYLLYSIERACMVTGQRLLGGVDWYIEGSYLLIRQQDLDGQWGTGQDAVVSQCFALLFLKRAFVPVKTPSNANDPVARPPAPAPGAGKPREME
jgi:hypothetical protein